MAESIVHMNYVRHMVDYAKKSFQSMDDVSLYVDLPESIRRPSATMGGHIPDLYYQDKKIFIIGEAKTENDIDNEHTRAQLNSYIEEVRYHNGEKHIIYCTGMLPFSQIKNIILRLKKKENLEGITFHIIDNFTRVNVV
jgi:hypothetical protein